MEEENNVTKILSNCRFAQINHYHLIMIDHLIMIISFNNDND